MAQVIKDQVTELRLALLILMFFGLSLVTSFVWENFDETKNILPGAGEMGFQFETNLLPQPSSRYVIEDFFRNLSYGDTGEATKYLYDQDLADNFLLLFKNLYYIKATNIKTGTHAEDTVTHVVTLNTIQEKGKSNEVFRGIKDVTITLKRDHNDNWKIYKIKY